MVQIIVHSNTQIELFDGLQRTLKSSVIFIFLVLQQPEWRIVPLLIVDIDAKEGKDVDKIGRNDRRRSDAN